MPKKKLKTQSRRMTTKKLSKINKKVKEYKRKMKKLAKHNPKRVGIQSRVRKEGALPKVMPFKETVLQEAEQDVTRRENDKKRNFKLLDERKAEKETEKAIRRSMSREEKMDVLMEQAMVPGGLARKQVTVPPLIERKKKMAKEMSSSVKDMTKAHYKDFKEVVKEVDIIIQVLDARDPFGRRCADLKDMVVKEADIIIQVLDARDPIGSRCADLEDYILESGPNKRLVLLLNKIDLIPRENLLEWLKYLRNEYPTMPFKASTQIQRRNLKQQKGKIENLPEKAVKMRGCLGGEKLMQLFANYCRNKDIKSKITVGVVGFPNVGKSSVINSLKRAKSCNVGAIPGVTRMVQRVYLDRRTWLLDSPGLVLTRDMSSVSAVLHNCVNVNKLDDPIPPVEAILKRCSKEQMMMRYLITDYTDVRHFLQLVAKRYGYMLQGGVPDITRAGKQILQEWNVGRIRYFTHPPKRPVNETHEKSEIVKKLSQPFDIASLIKNEEAELNYMLKGKSGKDMDIDPAADKIPDPTQRESTIETTDGDGDMDVDTETMTIKFPEAKKKNKKPTKESTKVDTDETLPGNQTSNKQVKKDFKKMKKERKRADAVATCLSDALQSALPTTSSQDSQPTESYDFNTDFTI